MVSNETVTSADENKWKREDIAKSKKTLKTPVRQNFVREREVEGIGEVKELMMNILPEVRKMRKKQKEYRETVKKLEEQNNQMKTEMR